MLKNTPFITNGILRALNYNWKVTCIFKYIAVTLTFVLITSLMVVFPISVFADEGTAYNGPHNAPCTVEAEDFNSGDEKAAYHEVDTDSNTTYRTSDVDITSSGGLIYIHNAQNNEWLKYTVYVSTAGWYKISMRFSNYNSDNNKQHILVCVDNMMKGVVEIPQTGGATTFTSVDGPQYVYLTQGNHVIFFQMYEKCNFDYFTISSQTAPNWQSPGIITPTYSTDDVIVADINVKNSPYNAAGDGIADDTTAIQNALNDAGYMGGGVVWVPSGEYKINGTLTIPYNVTLRGDWKSPDNGGGFGEGTILKAYSGKDNESGTAFISMSYCSTLKNLSIWYPEQDYTNVHAYPWTIESPRYNCTINVNNITLYNSYKAISVANGGSAHHITNIYGTILKTGIKTDYDYEEANIINIKFNNDFWSNSTLAGAPATSQQEQTLLNYTTINAVGIYHYYNDDHYMYDIDISDVNTGIIFDKSAAGDYWGISQKLNSTTYKIFDSNREWGNRFIDKIPEAASFSYTFAADKKPASTTRFYNVKATPYSAAGNALVDDTAAIQDALDDAGDAGGGTVYMPSGVYKISTNLSVPEGVELRGCFDSMHACEKVDGTVLLAYNGRGNASGTPFITLAANSGIRGFSIRYPEQKYDSVGTAYPWTVQGQGNGCWVRNMSFINSYQGIDLDSYRCDNFLLKGIWMCSLSKGIAIGKNSNGGCLEYTNISYGPWNEVYSPDIGFFDYGRTAITNYMRNNCYGYTYKACTNLKGFCNFTFYNYVGNLFTSEAEGSSSNITLYHSSNDSDLLTGFKFDSFGSGIDLIACTSGGYTEYALQSATSIWNGSVDLYGFHTWLYDNWDIKGGQFNFYNDYESTTTPAIVSSTQKTPRAMTYKDTATKPIFAFDQSESTKWESADGGTNWITIDLGRRHYINQVVLWHAGYGGESANLNTRDYKIQTSNDNTNWTDEWTISGNTASSNICNTSASARYVRILITQGTQPGYDGHARLYEFIVYGICERNLSSGKTATASAYYTENGGPDKAVDNHYTQKWCSIDTSPHWLEVDLGATYAISRWVVTHAGQGGEATFYNTKDFKLQISADGSTFTDIDSVTGNTANITVSNAEAVGRYARLWITQGTQSGYDGHARIYEFQVYGAPIENVATGKVVTADSCYSTTSANDAFDSSTSTKWVSQNSSSTHWLTVDLGTTYSINRWIVKHASSNGESSNYNTKDFKLQLSYNGTDWYDVDSVTGNTSHLTDRCVSSAGRYARLYITNPNQDIDNYARIYEFEVYGRQ